MNALRWILFVPAGLFWGLILKSIFASLTFWTPGFIDYFMWGAGASTGIFFGGLAVAPKRGSVAKWILIVIILGLGVSGGWNSLALNDNKAWGAYDMAMILSALVWMGAPVESGNTPRWILFIPAGIALGMFLNVLGQEFAAFLPLVVTCALAGAAHGLGVVFGGLLVAPRREDSVKWTLITIEVLLGITSAIITLQVGKDRAEVAVGIAMAITALALLTIDTQRIAAWINRLPFGVGRL